MKLTLLSKILLTFFVVLSVSSLFVLCTPNSNTVVVPQEDYKVVDNNGSQVVIVKDNDGTEFFMNYLLWKSIFDNSGIDGVRGYYRDHRYDSDWNTHQNEYKTVIKNTTINNYSNNEKSKPSDNYYKPSNGFIKKEEPVKSKESKGFTGKFFKPDVQTSSPKPNYQPSKGFTSTNKTVTTTKPSNTVTYKPSNGFKKKN